MLPRSLLVPLALAPLGAAVPRLVQDDTPNDALTEEAFRICDLDGNRWISLSEAQSTLGMSRVEYSSFDANNDGRVVLAEFQANAEAVIGRLGFAPSEELRRVDPTADVTVRSTEEALRELLALFDTDRSSGLEGSELEGLLHAYDLEISADQLLVQADRDDSGQLELEELGPLISLVSGPTFDSRSGAEPEFQPPPAAIRFLGSTTLPLPNEVGHFLRLDVDGDGRIGVDDLRTLAEGGRIPVRPGAVISALDRDGDGAIGRDEFWLSMGASADER